LANAVFEASAAEDYAASGLLIVLYEGSIRSRYQSVPDLIARIRVHQNLDAERASRQHCKRGRLPMYASLGFRERDTYADYPPEMGSRLAAAPACGVAG
jgi:hypothetical protein